MLGQNMLWVPGLNGTAARQYDLEDIAEQAEMPVEELIRILEKTHVLPGE